MKIILFAFVALLATANARPQEVELTDLVLEVIVNEIVESISQQIKQAGLDPFIIEEAKVEYNHAGILYSSRVDNFVLSGLSNIVVNSVSFSDDDIDKLELSLPRTVLSVDKFFSEVTIGSRNIKIEFSGSIALVDFRCQTVLDDPEASCQIGGVEQFILTISENTPKATMKIIGFALFALLATANSLPQQVQTSNLRDSRALDQIVIGLIDSVIVMIQERGLDPYVVELAKGEYTLGGFLFASGVVENFVFSGLSNIVVNSVGFSGSDLDIDISLPRLAASVDNVIGDVTIGSRNIQGEFSGRIAIVDLRLAARISLGLSAYLLDDLSLSCQLGGIEADFSSFILQGNDVTDSVNNFVGNTLPNLLIQYEYKIAHD
ncbi:hypothetical protein RR46_10845 [Papilio xuthus]|uniref:Uncharacterized protein n=1 Tax=Papilio xuthus TaxID=66420 RepID=A0A194PR31_PAPXU|nr:hypothetical protein RR46_10845 [Papilio xuthus]